MIREITLSGRRIEYELARGSVKNLNLRIRPDGSVRVSAPMRMPLGMIEAFIKARGEFVLEAIHRAEEKQRKCPPGMLLLLGREIPDTFSDDRARERFLTEQCIEAVSHSFAKLYPLFESRGVKLPEIKFRKMKSRWGSCRPKEGILTFNTALCHVPVRCIDYVVLHELTHFIRPDHSPEFKAELSAVMPDWKQRQNEIRQYEGLMR